MAHTRLTIAAKRDELARADAAAEVHLAIGAARQRGVSRRVLFTAALGALGLTVLSGQVVDATKANASLAGNERSV